MSQFFDRAARHVEHAAGSAWAFGAACATIIAWAITGPIFGWSDTWQLVINTGTTIVTFLMVFLIQATQSQDTRALHLKLDELIRVDDAARNSLLDAESLDQATLERLLADIKKANMPHGHG